jgi:hypothetical protein
MAQARMVAIRQRATGEKVVVSSGEAAAQLECLMSRHAMSLPFSALSGERLLDRTWGPRTGSATAASRRPVTWIPWSSSSAPRKHNVTKALSVGSGVDGPVASGHRVGRPTN